MSHHHPSFPSQQTLSNAPSNYQHITYRITIHPFPHRYAWAVGTGVALGPLLNVSVPVLLVTGALDEISPTHQGIPPRPHTHSTHPLNISTSVTGTLVTHRDIG